MSNKSASNAAWPAWQVGLASVLIVFHCFAVLINVLAAPSGPWPDEGTRQLATPPQFAHTLQRAGPAAYLRWLGLSNDYHFESNRPAIPAVWIELRLKNSDGTILSSVMLPERDGSGCIRQRQRRLARNLVDDQPVDPPRGESIAPANRSVTTERIWDLDGRGGLVLRTVPEHLVPRNRPVFRPSDRSLIFARAYVRYQCQTQGAATAELIRHTEAPIPPAIMFLTGPSPPNQSGKLLSNFGTLVE